MMRSLLAVIVAITLTFLVGVTLGQEERPAEHAMPGEHSAAEHGMHGNAFNEELSMEDVEAPSESLIIWFISALGWRYSILLPMSALMSFALTAVLVFAGKGRTTGAALGFIVAIPFLIGLFGMFDGLMASFMVVARSTAVPKPSVLAAGASMSIVTPLFGMFLMIPSYLLATVGLTVRALKNDPKP